MLLWELSILLPEKKFVSHQHKLISMLICILHGACGRDRGRFPKFHHTRVSHDDSCDTHVFITRVVPRVVLRAMVSLHL